MQKRPSVSNKRLDLNLVTGEKVQSIYFDPDALVDSTTLTSPIGSDMLYTPCQVVKSEEENSIYLVKAPSGEV